MAITVKHSKVSTIPDDADTSLVRPSDWNDDHVLTGTVPVANGGTGASTLTGYVIGNGTSAMTASATIPSTAVTGLGTMSTQNANNVTITGGTMSGVAITGYIPTTEKGAALGVATLDAGGQVPVSQLPPMGDLNYQGTWNASTNTPTLVSSTGTKGYYYVVSVAGTTNLNGITDWQVGDWAVFNGSVWQKIDNTDAVTSVNGYTGTVVLTTTDVAEGTNQYFTTARARASVSAGTGISYNSTTGVITNSSPSLGGDVVGPASATDNAVARFDTTTGKLLQNSVVTIGDTGATTGITTLSASTSVTTPIVQATSSAGLALKNSAGTTQISMGAGGGDNVTIAVATNINGANAQIDISPTGTGHVHIKPSGSGAVEIAPTNAGTMNNMVIGGTTPLAITGTTITATSFVGSGASLTNVVNSLTASTGISVSASTGAVTVTNTAPDQTVAIASGTGISVTGTYPNFTVTNTSPSSGGTVTSVTGTAPVVSSGGNTPAISMPAATTSVSGYLTSTDWTTFNSKGSGSVTSVAQSFTGGLISVAGSPITTSGTLALTVAGTSGGIPYFSSASTWATSAALAANALVIGGGAGVAPATTTTGTGVVTALGVNTGTAGAFVVNGGALGTPSSGTVTNLTGTASININGTVGATTASTGVFTTCTATTYVGVSGGTF
jgi:hypothetical protein